MDFIFADIKGMPINVAIQMFDSQSKANFQRQAIKTMKFIEEDEDTIIFQSNSILGDGTTAQISAMLTGRQGIIKGKNIFKKGPIVTKFCILN